MVLCLLMHGLLLSPLAAQELSVNKSASVAEVRGGDAFSYSIVVTNDDEDAVGGIRVRDVLPPGLTLGSPAFAGTGWTCSSAGGGQITVTCAFGGALAEGESSSVLTLNVVAPAVAGSLSNTAAAESEEDVEDSFPWTSAAVAVEVFLVSDLAVSKSGPEEVNAGQDYEYSFEVTNDGPHAATGVTVVDTIVGGASYVSVDEADWSCGSAPAAGGITLTCTLGPALAPSATAAFAVTVMAPGEAGTVSNQALVTSDNRLPDPANNESEVVEVTVNALADLSVTLSGPASAVSAEADYQYTVAVTNLGPSTAETVVATGSVPPEARLLSATGAGWSCRVDQVAGEFVCSRASQAALNTSPIAVSVRAPRNPPGSGVSGIITTGTAQVSAATPDPVASNNVSATVQTTVNAVLGLAIDKTSATTQVVPGEILGYDITISNTGPSDAVGDLRPWLDDVFPTQLRGTGTGACAGLPTTVPCWECLWTERPRARALVTDADAGVNGLQGVRQLAISPDNRHVYATGRFDDAIAVFVRGQDRSAGFGTLSFQSLVTGVDGADALAVSPTGLWLAAAGTESVYLYQRNPASGALTLQFEINGFNQPRGLAFGAGGRTLYVADGGASRIRVLAVDEDAAELAHVQWVDRVAGGGPGALLLAGVTSLAVSADGGFLYAAAPGDNALVSFAINAADGVLSGLSPASVQPQAGGQAVALRAVALGRDGQELYVAGGASGGANALFVFERHPGTGLPQATPQVFEREVAAGRLLGGIRSLVVDPHGAWLMAAATDDRSIVRFERDSGGTLGFVHAYTVPGEPPLNPPPPAAEALFPAGLAIDANGEHLYVAATSIVSDGPAAPALSAVVLYDVFGPGGCGNPALGTLRPGDKVSGNVEALRVRVPAGQSVTLRAHAVVSSAAQAGSMTNTAYLTDFQQNEIQDSHEHQILIAANVQVQKTGLSDRAVAGGPYQYSIQVTNAGGLAVNGLRLTDLFPFYPADPAGFVPGSVTWTCSATSGACCNPGGGSCGVTAPTAPVSGNIENKILNLAGQSSITFTASGTLHPDAAGTLSNTASATMPAGVDAVDPAALSSTHDETIEIQADAWIEKQGLGPGVDEAGMPFVSYRLRVGNNGPGSLSGLQVLDALNDPGLDAAGASWRCEITAGDGCCGFTGGSCPVDGGQQAAGTGAVAMGLALQPGAQAMFLVDVPLSALADEVVQNEAALQLPPGVTDPNLANNSASVLTRLAAQADLELNKQILVQGDAVPGEEVSFRISLTNDGPDNVAVSVRDLFPPELEQVAWTCDATTPVPGDLSYLDHVPHGEWLRNAAGVVTSADGRHVYVSSRGGSGPGDAVLPATVMALQRNITPGLSFGQLTMLETEIDGVNDPDDSGLTVNGIAGAEGMALSHDQRHLYVAGASADAVAVFRRDHVAGTPQFGRLTFVQARVNGDSQPEDVAGPAAGLGGARAVVVSPDDRHVYVAGELDNSVAVFRRDNGTGKLGYIGRIQAAQMPGSGLQGPTDLVMDSTGAHLYVSARGAVERFESADWFRTDTTAAVGGHSFFVPNEPGQAQKWLEQVVGLGTAEPTSTDDLVLEFQHRHRLDTPGGSCWDVGVLEISVNGGDSWQDVIQAGGEFIQGGYNGQQNGAEENPLSGRPGWCAESADWPAFTQVGVDLSGVSLPAGAQLRFRWGLGEGLFVGAEGWWLDDILLRQGAEVLLHEVVDAAPGSSSLTALARNVDDTSPTFGALSHIATYQPGVGGDDLSGLSGAVALAMDAGGENVYVAGRINEAIVGFLRNGSDGTLSLVQDLRLTDLVAPGDDIPETALAGLAGIAVSPDGEHLVATGRGANMLTVLRRAPITGQLDPEQVLQPNQPDSNPVQGGLDGPAGVAFSPDGQHVFTAAGGSHPAVGIFARRAPEPTFGFLETVIDGEDDGYGNTAVGLLGARALVVSPDGNYVYAVGFGLPTAGENGSLVVLERYRDRGDTSETRGGNLRFRQVLRDLQGGVQGLNGPTGIAIDENGRHLYVSSERDNAVAVFSIDESTGVVSQIASYFNGQNGVQGLLGASAVAVSPGGGQVYVAGRFDNAIAIFQRDDATGLLTYQGRVQNGSGGVQGLAGVSGLAMSTNGGHHLYAVSRQDHALVVFAREAGGGLTFRQRLLEGFGGQGLTGATGVAVTQEGSGSAHVLVTSPDLNSVAVYRRQTDSSLGSTYGNLTFVEDYRDGNAGVVAMGGARAVAVNRDSSRVYVVGQNDNSLVIFERNANPTAALFGRLAPLEVRRQNVGGVIGLVGPYGVAVSPDDRHIYTAALSSHSVAAFIRRSGSSCTTAGLGHIDDEEIFIAAGGTVTFIATGRIRPGATGVLNNTAELLIPPAVTNTNPDGETASSVPTPLVPRSALDVSKTDGRLSVVAGSRQEYRITIDNAGPSNAVGVTVTDLLAGNPDLLAPSATWMCRAVGSGLLERRDTVSRASLEVGALAGLAGVAWAADPDGQLGERVYATSVLGNALSSFSVNTDSGQLQYIESLVDGQNAAAGGMVSALRGARDVVTSSDGRFVYVTSQVDDAVVRFEVITDPTDAHYGRLRFGEALNSQTAGMSQFNQPLGLALSPDESRLYVASANSDSLYVFDRNGGNGSLSFARRVTNGVDGVTGLGGATAVAVSGDGAHVYVSAANDNAVTVFRVEADGALTWLESRRSPAIAGLTGAASVALDPDGLSVYVAGRDSNAIVVFRRNDNPAEPGYGFLGTPVQTLTPAAPGLQSLRGPRRVMVSADGNGVYVAGYDAGSVYAFKRDRNNGQLSFLARYRDGSTQHGLAGVSSLTQNASGSFLFSGALLDGAVTSFARPSDSRCSEDSGSGELDAFVVDVAAGGTVIIDLEVDIAPGAAGQTCPPPLDADRRCVINSVGVDIPNQPAFEARTATDASYLGGAANLVITKTDGLAEFRGLAEARALAVTAEAGGYLYVAAPGEAGIGVYRIQPFTGPTGDYPLTFVQFVRQGQGSVSGLTGVSDLVLSADGAHLYAAAALDSSVTWFRREAGSGKLQFVQRYNNNTGGVAGISGATALALSPDQRHLYVAGRNAGAIAIFTRQHDAEQSGYGGLGFAGQVQNGTAGVTQLSEPVDLVLDPSGRHLYAAAQGSSAILVFRRQDDAVQPGFGQLELLQVRQNGAAGVSGLLNVRALRLDAGGHHVYAAGSGNHSLVHFTRNTDSGSGQFGHLTFTARYTQGENGITGLVDVSDLVLSGDGGRLYATSPADHALAVFERNTTSGALVWLARIGEGDLQGEAGDQVQVSGLGGARAVVIGADGRVFVAGRAPGSLAVLAPAAEPPLAFAGALLQGGGGAAPGDDVTYVITVFNQGPSDVENARVRDIFPLHFESVTWTCSFEGSGSQCPLSGSGNIDAQVDIVAGGNVIFQATGRLRPDVAGTVVNTATVTLPGSVVDGDPVSNSATDDDTVLNSRADLAITIEDLPDPLIPGEDIGYRLRVTNTGPSDARGSRVRHALPELFAHSQWQCTPDREPGLIGLVEQTEGGLAGYTATALSPDGRHLYAVGMDSAGPSILMLRRNTLSGELMALQALSNGDVQPADNGPLVVDGLDGAAHVVVSADGAFVYVAGSEDDAIAVFARNNDDGRLSFVQVVRDNIGAVDGLGGVSFLALSPGGGQLYALGTLDNAVAVFARDAQTGALSFVQVRRSGTGDVVDMLLPRAMALSPDGNQLYVAATGSNAIARFQRAGNGELTFAGRVFQGQQQLVDGEPVMVDGLSGVRSLAFAGAGQLYAVSSTAAGHALTLLRRQSGGELLYAGVLRDGDLTGVPPRVISGLAGAQTVAVTADARQLYVAAADPVGGARTLAAFRIVSGLDLQYLETVQAGAAGNPDFPHRVLVSVDNRHLYSTVGQSPELDVYALQRGSECGREGNGGVFDVVDLEAGGEVVYDIQARVQANARGVVTGGARVDAAVAVHDPDINNNLATFTTSLQPAAAVAVTKTRLTDPVVAGSPVSWEITIENHGPSTIWGVAVHDDLPALPGNVPAPGLPGVIAGSAAWQCDSQTNISPTQFVHETGLSGAHGLAYSFDGRWLLAASTEAHSVMLYERDPASGWLTLRDQVRDGDPILNDDGDPVGEVAGLQGATAVAVSADLNHVYVAGRLSNAVAVFALDTDAGELHFTEWRRDAESTVSGMKGPSALVLSPDGEQLYVAARDDNAVTVFQRNPDSGRLQWRQSRRDGQSSVPINALVGVRDLVISPDGDYVYAAATQSHAVTVFRRDLFSGELSFVQRVANGDLQGPQDPPLMIAGLQLVRGIALSPQGGHLYAVSLAENTITVFGRNETSGRLSFRRRHADGQNGFQGLAGATAVAVSPDGEQVYVAGLNSGAVVALDRDWASGELTYLERRSIGSGGGANPQAIAISPDGAQLAVSSNDQGGAVTALRRLPEGYCGIESLAGDSLVDVVNLAAGGRLTYTVDAVVHPGARGELINIAEIQLPVGIVPLTPGDHVGLSAGDIEVVTDLRIAKQVAEATLVAGLPVVYTLVVGNDGPSHALGATVIDHFPPELLNPTWSCTPSAQSSCTATGAGSLNDSVDVLADGTLVYIVNAQVDPGAMGQVTNIATVTAPADGSDPDPDDNVAQVTSPVVGVADLAVAKSAISASASPGEWVQFLIEVDNLGPSDALMAGLQDLMPAAISEAEWTCEATGGATCPAAAGSGDVMLNGLLAAGGRWSVVVDARIHPQAPPGEVVNTAVVSVASPVTDPEPVNDVSSASVTITGAVMDLGISKSVDLAQALPGEVLTYHVRATNHGPAQAESVHIQDLLPPELINASWFCVAEGDVTCPDDSGIGSLDYTLSLPPGSALNWHIEVTIDPATPAGPKQLVVNSASIELLSSGHDPDLTNNVATAVTVLDLDRIFRDAFSVLPPIREEQP